MKFKEIVAKIVADNPLGISPPEIQKTIEKEYPNFYSTDTHIRNVKKGHYSDLHHALKAQVYSLVRQCDDFVCDKSVKPFLVFLTSNDLIEDDTYNEDYEDSVGKVYILKTGTFTSSGDEILKIGRTTQDIEKRINQLYTTGVPFQFEVYKVFEVNEHIELESALHKLLSKYRLNKSREFFTSKALPHIEGIIDIHKNIQNSQ